MKRGLKRHKQQKKKRQKNWGIVAKYNNVLDVGKKKDSSPPNISKSEFAYADYTPPTMTTKSRSKDKKEK